MFSSKKKILRNIEEIFQAFSPYKLTLKSNKFSFSVDLILNKYLEVHPDKRFLYASQKLSPLMKHKFRMITV